MKPSPCGRGVVCGLPETGTAQAITAQGLSTLMPIAIMPVVLLAAMRMTVQHGKPADQQEACGGWEKVPHSDHRTEQQDRSDNTRLDEWKSDVSNAETGTDRKHCKKNCRALPCACSRLHGCPDADGKHRQQVIQTGYGVRQSGREAEGAVAGVCEGRFRDHQE